MRILKLEYICDVKVYLAKESEDAMDDLTTAHGTVLQLVRRAENKGHMPYIDNSYLHNFLKTSIPE